MSLPFSQNSARYSQRLGAAAGVPDGAGAFVPGAGCCSAAPLAAVAGAALPAEAAAGADGIGPPTCQMLAVVGAGVVAPVGAVARGHRTSAYPACVTVL